LPKAAKILLAIAGTLLASWLTVIGLRELFFASLNETGPSVERFVLLPSPDSHWQAKVEVVDNGMGFGMGNIYNEIHIFEAGKSSKGHGDKEPTAVFYIEAERTDRDFPTLKWLGPRQLVIEYSDLHKPGKHLTQYRGISIEYRSRPAA